MESLQKAVAKAMLRKQQTSLQESVSGNSTSHAHDQSQRPDERKSPDQAQANDQRVKAEGISAPTSPISSPPVSSPPIVSPLKRRVKPVFNKGSEPPIKRAEPPVPSEPSGKRPKIPASSEKSEERAKKEAKAIPVNAYEMLLRSSPEHLVETPRDTQTKTPNPLGRRRTQKPTEKDQEKSTAPSTKKRTSLRSWFTPEKESNPPQPLPPSEPTKDE